MGRAAGAVWVVLMAALLLALALQHRAHEPLLAVAVGVGIVALLAWAVVRVRGSRP